MASVLWSVLSQRLGSDWGMGEDEDRSGKTLELRLVEKQKEDIPGREPACAQALRRGWIQWVRG